MAIQPSTMNLGQLGGVDTGMIERYGNSPAQTPYQVHQQVSTIGNIEAQQQAAQYDLQAKQAAAERAAKVREVFAKPVTRPNGEVDVEGTYNALAAQDPTVAAQYMNTVKGGQQADLYRAHAQYYSDLADLKAQKLLVDQQANAQKYMGQTASYAQSLLDNFISENDNNTSAQGPVQPNIATPEGLANTRAHYQALLNTVNKTGIADHMTLPALQEFDQNPVGVMQHLQNERDLWGKVYDQSGLGVKAQQAQTQEDIAQGKIEQKQQLITGATKEGDMTEEKRHHIAMEGKGYGESKPMTENQEANLWKSFGKDAESLNASSRSALGQAIGNNMRADRALAILRKKDPSWTEIRALVNSDLMAIMKGGAPDQISLQEGQYSTLSASIQKYQTYLTGDVPPSGPQANEIVKTLLADVKDIKDVDDKVIDRHAGMIGDQYAVLANKDPERFIRMLRNVGQLKDMRPVEKAPYGQPSVEANPEQHLPQPKTKADVAALPSGTHFMWVDGKEHVRQ